MKAVCYYGTEDIRVERVPDPQLLNPRDAIVKITATAICGSDLHSYGGYIPTMKQGDILGHEFMGVYRRRRLEAHGTTLDAWYDRAKKSLYLATDRPHALRQAISACRKGGTVSIPGVYGGWLDKFPLGAAFAKGLTLKMGQTHMHKYLPGLLGRVERGEIDPSFIITHRVTLDDAPRMYHTFREKSDDFIKVVMRPANG
jgi:threonine dehydrogenase-like Zn-dependent dehydrogenase